MSSPAPFDPAALCGLARKQLQALAKAAGIRANTKTVVMIAALQEYHAEHWGDGTADGRGPDEATTRTEKEGKPEREEGAGAAQAAIDSPDSPPPMASQNANRRATRASKRGAASQVSEVRRRSATAVEAGPQLNRNPGRTTDQVDSVCHAATASPPARLPSGAGRNRARAHEQAARSREAGPEEEECARTDVEGHCRADERSGVP